MWRTEVNVGYLPQSPFTLVLTWSLSLSLDFTGWPASPQDPPVSAPPTPMMGLQIHSVGPQLWHGFWGIRSSSSCVHGKHLADRVTPLILGAKLSDILKDTRRHIPTCALNPVAVTIQGSCLSVHPKFLCLQTGFSPPSSQLAPRCGV